MTKTKSKLTFKKLLDETKRTQYVDDDVVASVEPCDPQEIEIVKLNKYVSASDLEGELAKLGYELAHPYALALYSKEHDDVMLEKTYVATQWKDKEGEYCWASFYSFSGGDRGVSVHRRSYEWHVAWGFACSRKHPALGSSGSLDLGSQKNEELEKAVETCKAAGLVVYKPL